MDEGWDAIVVGSGAGGGTAARALTRRGKRVLVLEKGSWQNAEDFLPYDELHFAEHKALLPSVVDDPNVYVGLDGSPRRVLRWWIANMVGGATMLWEANVPRYSPEDFQISSVMREPPADASMVDWPWTYEEFEPYFELAEWEWGVSGEAGQVPSQEPTRPGYRYPMPPLRAHASVPFLKKAFGAAGMHPYETAKAINSRTFDGRPACPYCGYCQTYGCAVNDRASSANTVLASALASGLCEVRTRHCVTRIDHQKGVARGVFFKTEPDGPEQHVGAPIVVVAIQAIQSARLFLYSEVPDPNGLIGRYLTYHPKGTAVLTFADQPVWDEGADERYQPRTALGNLQLRDLYMIDDPKRPELSKGGKFSLGDPYTTQQAIKAVSGTGLWGDDLRERLVELRSQGGVLLSFTGEALSRYNNRVELDPESRDLWGVPLARVHYRHHEYDRAISQYCLERVTGILEEAGGELRNFAAQGEENEGYGHNHGTLRAGSDPGASVLDPMCQSHTVRGLYCLDSAFMPTAGASNPTLTVIANAFRVCERI